MAEASRRGKVDEALGAGEGDGDDEEDADDDDDDDDSDDEVAAGGAGDDDETAGSTSPPPSPKNISSDDEATFSPDDSLLLLSSIIDLAPGTSPPPMCIKISRNLHQALGSKEKIDQQSFDYCLHQPTFSRAVNESDRTTRIT